jgi:methyltransferase (TIGR00027 family)
MKNNKKRIEIKTSRTAEMTCMMRATSFYEKKSQYKSNDYIAPKLLPKFLLLFIKLGMKLRAIRNIFISKIAPKGIYEYVIARTKYIDAIFKRAVLKNFHQILIFGAGFDSRGIRLLNPNCRTKVFELDVPITQNAKINQLKKRKVKTNLHIIFVPIDFNKESVKDKLLISGFEKHKKSLFILEGLSMYLSPEAIDSTFNIVNEFAGAESEIVFDYIYSSVLRRENLFYGEKDIINFVINAGEGWTFGIERAEIEMFLKKYNFTLIENADSEDLENKYFKDENKNIIAKINGTHSIAYAKR